MLEGRKLFAKASLALLVFGLLLSMLPPSANAAYTDDVTKNVIRAAKFTATGKEEITAQTPGGQKLVFSRNQAFFDGDYLNWIYSPLEMLPVSPEACHGTEVCFLMNGASSTGTQYILAMKDGNVSNAIVYGNIQDSDSGARSQTLIRNGIYIYSAGNLDDTLIPTPLFDSGSLPDTMPVRYVISNASSVDSSLITQAFSDPGSFFTAFGAGVKFKLYTGNTDNELGSSAPIDGSMLNKDTISTNLTINKTLYANTDYRLVLSGAHSITMDCVSGKAVATLSSATAWCSADFTGVVRFKMGKDYKMTVTAHGDDYVKTQMNGKDARNLGPLIHGLASKTSPFDEAISSMVRSMANFITASLAWVGSTITWLVGDFTADQVVGSKDGKNPGVSAAWTRMRDVGLSLMVMALVIIAFANVVGVDLDNYGLNRMIPRIIISIIMAYGSWIIFVFFFDMTAVLSAQANGILAGNSGMAVLQSVNIVAPDTGSILASLGGTILLFILCIAVWITGLVLVFLLTIRVVFLAFLLAVAPLAFMLNIMPFSANLYKQWWSEFWKWMFMGPMVIVILALGSILAGNMGLKAGGTSLNGVSDLTTANISNTSTTAWGFLMGMIVLGASMYLAATLPLQWGGKIMQGWSKAGKWGRDNLAGGKYVKQGWSAFNKSRADRSALRFERGREFVANKVPGGRMLTGTNKAQATALREGIDKTYEGMFSKLEATDLQKEIGKGGRRGMIASKVMQSKYSDMTKGFALEGQLKADGQWNTEDPLQRKSWEDAAKARATGSEYEGYTDSTGTFNTADAVAPTNDGGQMGKWMEGDRDYLNDMIKENPEAALMAATSGKNSQLAGQIRSSEAGKSWLNKGHKATKSLAKNAADILRDPKNAGSMPAIGHALAGAGTSEEKQSALIAAGLSSWEAGELVSARAAKEDYMKKYHDPKTGTWTNEHTKLVAQGSQKQNAAFSAIEKLVI